VYEAAVKDALYTVINNNTSTLLSGLTQQGKARQMQIVKEILAPAQYSYYVALAVENMRTWEDSGVHGTNAATGTFRAEYNCVVEVFEYARALPGDLHTYENAGEDFDLLVARVIKLLREQASFTSSVHGSHSFKLGRLADPRDQRPINVEIADLPPTTTGGQPAFYARLLFTLTECSMSLAGAA